MTIYTVARRRWAIGVSAIALALGAAPARAVGSDEAPPSVQDISARIRKGLEGLRNFHVKYTIASDLRAPKELEDAFMFGLFQDWEEYAVAGAGPGRMRTRNQKWWEPTALSPKKPETWRQSWATYDGKAYRNISTECRPPEAPKTEGATMLVTPYEDIIEQSNIYFEGIGSFFYDGRALDVWRRRGDKYGREPKYPFSLPAALESQPYRVRGKKDVVEGVGCWVVEIPGRDRIWLDPGHGFAVVKREWLWDDGKTPMFRWVNSDFKEVVPGLWWPMRARRDVVTHVDRNTSGGDQVTVTNNVRVLTVLVNNVPDTVFALTFPPGTRVLDDTRVQGKDGQSLPVSYVIGGTPETSEIALQSAIALRLASDRRSSWSSTFLWINVMVLLAIGVVFVFRRMSRRGPSPSLAGGSAATGVDEIESIG